MVDFDLGLEQPLDDRDVATIGGTDQPRPVEAVLRVDVGAGVERELEQRRVVADLAGGDQVRALLGRVLRVDVGAGVDEQARDLDVVSVRSGNESGCPGVVAGLDARALLEQRARPRRRRPRAPLRSALGRVIGSASGDDVAAAARQKRCERRPHRARARQAASSATSGAGSADRLQVTPADEEDRDEQTDQPDGRPRPERGLEAVRQRNRQLPCRRRAASSVVDTAIVERIAMPTAPPICCEVFINPDARPASCGTSRLSGWRGSNPRPLRPERSALPSCATPRGAWQG